MPEITHVVLVAWRPGVPQIVRDETRGAARSMRGAIPGIVALSEGPSVSPEGLEHGYDYGLVVRFESAEARDRYLPHPAHRPFAELLAASADRLVVYDIAG